MLEWARFIWKSTCRRTQMCVEIQTVLEHFNVASSRTGSECRCAAGTQIVWLNCFVMQQAFSCISCCMLKHHRWVSPNGAWTALYTQWLYPWLGGWLLVFGALGLCFHHWMALFLSTATPSRHCGTVVRNHRATGRQVLPTDWLKLKFGSDSAL